MTAAADLVIEVRNLRKHFSVPGAAPRGTLNRILHPVQRGRRRTLRVLDGISFDVRGGELFTVVGRNGSGKSTLLRVLGSIYRADSGWISVTGTLAPFVELGVGFQPRMSARQNIALNGVMLGLSRREVQRRIEDVLAWAELEEFGDVQLKNFSSGMRMKLAFGSMLQADPDIYLIDEILAVGDEAFRAKCTEEFASLKQRGKTIVMATHKVNMVERESDRAMWINNGTIGKIGDPASVVGAYKAAVARPDAKPQVMGPRRERGERRRDRPWRATIEMIAIDGFADRDPPRVAVGEPLHAEIRAETSGWVHNPTIELAITDLEGTRIAVSRDFDYRRLPVLKPGETMEADVRLENPLAPGQYSLECTLLRADETRTGSVSATRSLEFVVEGVSSDGFIELERKVSLSQKTKFEIAR
jgi:ABC-type polysaccharide/polyol phosphate transport system ATPase subunit